jgi:hypothetical protein
MSDEKSVVGLVGTITISLSLITCIVLSVLKSIDLFHYSWWWALSPALIPWMLLAGVVSIGTFVIFTSYGMILLADVLSRRKH